MPWRARRAHVPEPKVSWWATAYVLARNAIVTHDERLRNTWHCNVVQNTLAFDDPDYPDSDYVNDKNSELIGGYDRAMAIQQANLAQIRRIDGGGDGEGAVHHHSPFSPRMGRMGRPVVGVLSV